MRVFPKFFKSEAPGSLQLRNTAAVFIFIPMHERIDILGSSLGSLFLTITIKPCKKQ
uniref:Serine/threonine-protein kinase PBS1 n=1 Tax=Rhizophora mucronata TaxID=61149 RepID=A0A2P2LPU2_RHIMU